jgi:hypothetical protein
MFLFFSCLHFVKQLAAGRRRRGKHPPPPGGGTLNNKGLLGEILINLDSPKDKVSQLFPLLRNRKQPAPPLLRKGGGRLAPPPLCEAKGGGPNL